MSGLREQSITSLPQSHANPQAAEPPNPAQDVLMFVGDVTSVVTAPVDMLNQGVASLTNGISNALPSFPAARTLVDLVFGWPHSHPHPPSFGTPLPSIGPVLLAGSLNVLINGLPAARCGDIGFGAWCGGYFPMFEVFTGSSNVFIGGARASRMLIDFTRHCSLPFMGKNLGKGLGAMDKVMMGVLGGMGVLGVAAQATDSMNQAEAAENADSAEVAAAASAASSAAALGAAMTAAQTAADMAALALSVGMGKDPGLPPLLCFGNFITGSMNVLIGGLPIPGWTHALAGLGKLLKKGLTKVQQKLPKGSRLNNALCKVTGHPVDIASGRVFTSQKDFELPGRIPINFTRVWDSSACNFEGVLGKGWIHPYEIHLWQDDEQQMMILRNEEGRVCGFDIIDINEKSFNPLEKRCLERIGEQEYIVRTHDGLRYRFGSVDNRMGGSERDAFKLIDITDRNGNKLSLIYEDGHLFKLVDNTGVRVELRYSEFENNTIRLTNIRCVIAKQGSALSTIRLVDFSFDAQGHLVVATDRTNSLQRYAYHGDLLVRETNRNGLNFYFEYVGKGANARCVRTWGDRGIYDRHLEYHTDKRMTVVEDSFGRKTTWYFNEYDLPVQIINALGGEKRFEYSANGELLTESDEIGRTTKYEYNEYGYCSAVIFADGASRQFLYNNESLPTKFIDETGSEFSREYDDKGNVIATIDALQIRREYKYNGLGELISATNPLSGKTQFKWNEYRCVVEVVNPSNTVIRYEYNELQKVATVVDHLMNRTRYIYDKAGRLIEITRPDGTKNKYEFDPENNLTAVIDTNGVETRFRYTDLNLLSEQINPLGYKQQFLYDTEAKLIEVRNEKDEFFKINYDELYRISSEIGFDGLKKSYQYDSAGQLLRRIDPSGKPTEFTYDERGKVTRRIRSDGSVIETEYDSVGRVIKAISPGNHIDLEYDVVGRIIRESQNGKIIEHQYDSLGRRTKRTSPSGRDVNFEYNADGSLSQLQIPQGAISFEHNKSGHLTKRKLPNGLEESFYYDVCGRIIEQSLHNNNHETLIHRGYKYNSDNNLVELKDILNGARSFSYDPIQRLSNVSDNEKEREPFTYDSTGNLLRRGNSLFSYSEPDRLNKVNDTELFYDSNGNLIEKKQRSSTISYTYDPDNQLIAVDKKDGERVEFSYDAFGRRTAKQTKDCVVGFIWDGDVLLGEERDDIFSEYVFSVNNFEPICRFDDEHYAIFHNDHIGTPKELTNEHGKTSWSAVYDVYGRISSLRQVIDKNSIRFQGQYEDEETGLFYNRFRYYDSDTGRYISQDPSGICGGLNPYSYVSNPVNWTDPFGLAPDYYPVDSLGRPTGGFVELTSPNDLRPTGSSPPTFDPPGWVGGQHPNHQQRSHVIGDTLGGSGSDRGNLVTLTDGSNHPGMSKYEGRIRKHVRAGNTVLYEVKVNYDGDNTLPRSVHMYAIDQDGRVVVDELVYNGRRQNTVCC